MRELSEESLKVVYEVFKGLKLDYETELDFNEGRRESLQEMISDRVEAGIDVTEGLFSALKDCEENIEIYNRKIEPINKVIDELES